MAAPSPKLRARSLALEAVLRARCQSAPFETVEWIWKETIAAWGDVGRAALGRVDRFYLLTVLLHRPDACHPWLYARCREVEANPDGYLDLWAREHYKSTIITFAGVIQELLRDPNLTVGIFSHTKPTAKKFFTQIKIELETNEELKRVYPDVLYQNPRTEAAKWSDEKGITVRRDSNAKEASVEAHGLVDGQPTGAHFNLLVYDDVVTLESVTTPEQVQKTTDAHALSDNLGARGENGRKRKWHVGTRYKFGDTYQSLIDRKSLIPRLYPATDDGTPNGNPVFLTREALADIRRDQPSAIFAAQQLMNPAAGLEAMFRKEWLEGPLVKDPATGKMVPDPRRSSGQFLSIRPGTLTVYIMCDPASSRKKNSDRTAIMVVGIDATRNKYLLGGYVHKMGLSERWQKLRDLQRYWSQMPGVQFVKVGYERYGMRDAMEHFEERMLVERCGFEIIELAWPAEGGNAKYDRIQRLEPDFRNRKWWFAGVYDEVTKEQQAVIDAGQGYRVFKPTRQLDHEGRPYALNKVLFDEYLVYPYVNHDDALDCLSRIYDMDPAPPVLIDSRQLEPEVFADGS